MAVSPGGGGGWGADGGRTPICHVTGYAALKGILFNDPKSLSGYPLAPFSKIVSQWVSFHKHHRVSERNSLRIMSLSGWLHFSAPFLPPEIGEEFHSLPCQPDVVLLYLSKHSINTSTCLFLSFSRFIYDSVSKCISLFATIETLAVTFISAVV